MRIMNPIPAALLAACFLFAGLPRHCAGDAASDADARAGLVMSSRVAAERILGP